MSNPLIGVILSLLLKDYQSGNCDNIDNEDEILEDLMKIKDKLELTQDAVMTIEEVSLYLGVTRQTINNYVQKGYLHPKKQLGGVLLFKKREVKELIKKLKQ